MVAVDSEFKPNQEPVSSPVTEVGSDIAGRLDTPSPSPAVDHSNQTSVLSGNDVTVHILTDKAPTTLLGSTVRDGSPPTIFNITPRPEDPGSVPTFPSGETTSLTADQPAGEKLTDVTDAAGVVLFTASGHDPSHDDTIHPDVQRNEERQVVTNVFDQAPEAEAGSTGMGGKSGNGDAGRAAGFGDDSGEQSDNDDQGKGTGKIHREDHQGAEFTVSSESGRGKPTKYTIELPPSTLTDPADKKYESVSPSSPPGKNPPSAAEIPEGEREERPELFPQIPIFRPTNEHPVLDPSLDYRDQIRELVKQGFRDSVVASVMHCTAANVNFYRKILTIGPDRENIPTQQRITEEMRRLVLEGFYANEEIANALGYNARSVQTVRLELMGQTNVNVAVENQIEESKDQLPVIEKIPTFSSLSISVIRELRQLIVNGELQEGTRLAPASELAEQIGCSREVAGRIYLALESEGWIESRQGVGTFVLREQGEGIPRIAQVTQKYRDLIRNGTLPGGSLFPSVKTLISVEGLERNTVQVILLQLASEDLIDSRANRGTFVKEHGEEEIPYGVFERTGHQLHSRIPSEIQDAGLWMQRIRTSLPFNPTSNSPRTLTQQEMAEYLGVTRFSYRNFEEGRGYLELDKVYELSLRFYNELDPLMNIFEQVRTEFNMARILAQPDMTIDRASQLLRLSSRSTIDDIVQETDLSYSAVSRSMRDVSPKAYTADQYLRTAGLRLDSKAAQIFHSLRTKCTMLSLEDFAAAESKDQVGYYIDVTGETDEDVSIKIQRSRSSVSLYKSGENTITAHSLARLLGTDKGILYTVMLRRSQEKPVILTREDRRELFNRPLLFAENIRQLNEFPYQLSEEEDRLRHEIKEVGKMSEIFKLLRLNPSPAVAEQLQELPISYIDLEKRDGGYRNKIYNNEQEKHSPTYPTIVNFCGALGYGFFHPITQEMLHINWLLRRPS